MSCVPPVDIVRRPRLWRPDDYWVRTGMISRATAIAETAEALLGGLYVYSPRQRQMVLHRPLIKRLGLANALVNWGDLHVTHYWTDASGRVVLVLEEANSDRLALWLAQELRALGWDNFILKTEW